MHIPHMSGTPRVPLDRFGAPIAPQDLVTYAPGDPVVMTVSDVRPMIERPGVPAGSVQVTLSCTVNVLVQAGTRTPGLTRIGYLDGDGRTPMIGAAVRPPAGTQGADPGPGPDSDAQANGAGPQLVLP